ncbi:MAG: YlxR family protein [Lachnospiraceae bacterium]|nr:YlxR family protein [Lachnospiraceae bacterium]
MAKKIPVRQCIGCGELKSKKELLRILRTEQEGILLDATGRKNGRGAYICPNAECLKRAKKAKGLERSFKMQVPDEIYDSLTKEIEAFEKSVRDAGNGDESG